MTIKIQDQPWLTLAAAVAPRVCMHGSRSLLARFGRQTLTTEIDYDGYEDGEQIHWESKFLMLVWACPRLVAGETVDTCSGVVGVEADADPAALAALMAPGSGRLVVGS